MARDYFEKAGVAGGACAIAGATMNPFDVVKIRMQNNCAEYPWPEKSFLRGLINIYRDEGLPGLSRGMHATILRELLYSTIRMGAYEPILAFVNATGDKDNPSVIVKYVASMMSGAIGASLANPTDLIKVRFQANMPGQQLPYSTFICAFRHILTHDGIAGLWRGSTPTIARAAVLTSAQLGSYDSIKNNILKRHFKMQDGAQLHLFCSLLAGIITTTASNPVDVIKTRYMSHGAAQYRSVIHCVAKTYLEGGVRAFFRGWFPSYCRIGPHTMISFMLIEQGRKLLGLKPI